MKLGFLTGTDDLLVVVARSGHADIPVVSPENPVLFDSAGTRLHPVRLTSAQRLVASGCGTCSTEFRYNGTGALMSFEASKGSTCFFGIFCMSCM